MDDVTKDNIDGIDFVEIYSKGILIELGLELKDDEQTKKMIDLVSNRVLARLYLEMVAMLTPEQAEKVAADVDNENPNPGKTLRAMADDIPDFQVRIAKILSTIRSELLKDLEPLVVKNGQSAE